MYITVNKDYEGLSRRSPESRTNGGRKRERWDLHVKRESQRRPARIARGLGEGECECEEGEVHGEIKTEIARHLEARWKTETQMVNVYKL